MERSERDSLQRDLAALADGDREAFHPIYLRLWPMLRGFAARALDERDADDVAQEALLRVFSRASEFDRERDALSWVLGIAAWEIRTFRKRRQRRREAPVGAVSARPAPEVSPEDAAVRADLAAALEQAMARLRPDEAATLVAYARGERPDLPGPTFRKRVERALRRLRSAWRTAHGID